MEFDYDNDRIVTDQAEKEALHTPDDVEWTITGAWKLYELAEHQLRCVDAIDPSVTPVVAERAKLMSQKMRHTPILQSIISELVPHLSAEMVSEAEDFLNGLNDE